MGKTLLILGSGGQVGSELIHSIENLSYRVIAFTKEQLNITDYASVETIIERIEPDVIVNCAAVTNVDWAEVNPAHALEINTCAVKRLAEIGQRLDAVFVQLSTNYVFNGIAKVPYLEGDDPGPINIYGETKLRAERYIQQTLSKYFIIRTSWVFGLQHENFLTNFLAKARAKTLVGVIDNQISSPTYALDLVNTIMKLIETDRYGLYHVTNTGSCTRLEFAEAILNLSEMKTELCPVNSTQQVAKRPSYSVLGHQELNEAGITPLRHWKDALESCVSVKKSEG